MWFAAFVFLLYVKFLLGEEIFLYFIEGFAGVLVMRRLLHSLTDKFLSVEGLIFDY